MDKKRLEKLKALIKEDEHLQAEYDKMLFRPKEFTADTVKDYRTGRPRTITIQGQGDADYVRMRQKIYANLQEIQRQRKEIEDWIAEVEDPEIRDIIRLRYINGMTQQEIADELGYSRTAIMMKLQRFWKK